MLNTVIVGAGPYGLSVAAHLRNSGISFRIFGRPMDSWTAHMPKGMCLKSDGFASNIYDPNSDFTLEHFCSGKQIKYAHTGIPVRLDTFAAYGRAFCERMVPELEDKLVVSVERLQNGFELRLDDGETLAARRVILAVGITHFPYVPDTLAQLPAKFMSHSFVHHDLEKFRGRSVAVIGGGASALDLAGLFHEAGANVQLVSRRQQLKFHSGPSGKPRTLWQRLRHPSSGLGPGLRNKFFSDFPMLFHFFPEQIRLEAVRRILGPSGGWFIKDKVIGKVPLMLGCTAERASIKDGKVYLSLRSNEGQTREIQAEHVIAATGYKVNMDRLKFLSEEIRSEIKTVDKSPVLSRAFESSIPGLYFVGVAAANSFGPLMRFAFGAGFAARTVTKAVRKSARREVAVVPIRTVATTGD